MDEPGRPRFSVVIPTCARNASLRACLDRLAPGCQTLPAAAYEVIVTDDGAPPHHAREMIARDYPWVQWVEGPRRGPAANRNRGVTAARAEWFIFTDDDCLPDAAWLAGFADYLDQHPGSPVLEGRTEDGGAPPTGPFYIAPVNRDGGFLWSCNLAISRTLFADLDGFDANFPYPHLEDVDLRLRLEDRGIQYAFVRDARVDHPPRPIQSAVQWARSQESSYYLAAKRGVSAHSVGFSASMYVRGCRRALRHCRTWGERLQVLGRSVVEVILVAWHIPGWRRRYRHDRSRKRPSVPL